MIFGHMEMVVIQEEQTPEAVFGGFFGDLDGTIGGTGDDTAIFYHDFSGQDLGVHFVGEEVFISDEWS